MAKKIKRRRGQLDGFTDDFLIHIYNDLVERGDVAAVNSIAYEREDIPRKAAERKKAEAQRKAGNTGPQKLVQTTLFDLFEQEGR